MIQEKQKENINFSNSTLFLHFFRYVMKPSFMLGASSPWNPNEPGSVAPSVIKKVEIEIISARQLPKPGQTTKGSIIDPFVSLTLHGIGADHKTFKTATVKGSKSFLFV